METARNFFFETRGSEPPDRQHPRRQGEGDGCLLTQRHRRHDTGRRAPCMCNCKLGHLVLTLRRDAPGLELFDNQRICLATAGSSHLAEDALISVGPVADYPIKFLTLFY